VPEFKLPDVGEGLTEAEIVSWKVEVGDVVRVNDIVVEIETAKSLVELPSPYAGTVVSLHVREGETVAVGTPIITVGDPAPVIDLSNPAATGGGENQTLVGYGPRAASSQRRPRRGGATPSTDAGAAAQSQLQGAFGQGAAEAAEPPVAEESGASAPPAVVPAASLAQVRVLAKPPVRKLAKDLGVELSALTPTGPDGTVTREDVRAAADGARGSVEPVRTAGRETREPIKGVRKAMAQAMVGSAFTAPHVTEWVTVDVTATMRLVERLRGHSEFRGIRVSPLLVLAKAVCLAARRTPEVNATWDEDRQEVVFKDYVNLGIAAATPRGLLVPNVKNAETLTLAELGAALTTLTSTARDGRTRPEDMTGGSFTITNVGVFGIDSGTPIINPGESAILALGAVRPQPWVHKHKIKVRQVTTLALSFDHRLVDGEKGSRFLADVAGVLHDPGSALML
jgi:2-oxoisovalerate dehydrogenase E2 component (dihydrolipoyl transacylase)